MTISSRTPDGFPNRCPICGVEVRLEFSPEAGDATCPACGALLWKSSVITDVVLTWVRTTLSIPDGELSTLDELDSFDFDSLDAVELIMGLEEEFDISIPDEDYAKIKSIRDLIRYLAKR